jgi:hopene-associated glycosyltransferase HpnB
MIYAGWALAASWLFVALLRGMFWQTRDKFLAPTLSPTAGDKGGATAKDPRIAVIVPARNEADVIGRAVASLLAQKFHGTFKIFVVDDNSTDGTLEVLRVIAAAHRNELVVLKGKPLPSCWTGKVWAMQQGWEAAQEFSPNFVWLTDADVEHAPDTLNRLAAKSSEGFDLVSLMVRLHCDALAEKLMIPAFVYFFFMLYPPKWFSDRKSKTAGAAGGCVLLKAESLRKANAFESIAGEIIDDCSLAREVKRAGGKIWLGLADGSRSIRGYNGMGGIVNMIARTAFNQLGHSAVVLALCIAGMMWIFVAPIALLFTASWLGAAIALAIMVATYVPMVRHYKLSPMYALSLPASACVYMFATAQSALKYWSGGGGDWKGRKQDRR